MARAGDGVIEPLVEVVAGDNVLAQQTARFGDSELISHQQMSPPRTPEQRPVSRSASSITILLHSTSASETSTGSVASILLFDAGFAAPGHEDRSPPGVQK